MNLEFMPAAINGAEGYEFSDRQVQLARKWHKAGGVDAGILKAVEAAR